MFLPKSIRDGIYSTLRFNTKIRRPKQPSQEIQSPSETESNISPSGSTQKVEDQKQPSQEINADVHKALETLDNAIMEVSAESPTVESESKLHRGHIVVVAIDFGTTYSGYAYSFTRDPSQVHMMRKWEGGDGGVVNEKTPTCILLTPEGQFHSFGYSARDSYHDLDPGQAKTWLYFDKFKMLYSIYCLQTMWFQRQHMFGEINL